MHHVSCLNSFSLSLLNLLIIMLMALGVNHVANPKPLPGDEIQEPHRALMAHPCNPSFSGGRDQEDPNSKPAWANSSQDLS
jgi:hypothetical protein